MRILSNRLGRLIASLAFGLFLVSSVVFALVQTTQIARAAGPTCTVNSSGVGVDYATIQAAINDTGCTTINVTTVGTHTENLTINRSLTLNGAGKTSTIIDGNGTDRVVTIDGAGIIVRINDLRITNGDATGAATSFRNGGGILVTNNATLRGTNLQIDRNLASSTNTGFGGGVAINTASVYLTSTMIYSNTADQRSGVLTGNGRGGGMYVNNAVLHLINSQVLTNLAAFRATSGETASGGGLHVAASSQVYLSNNTWQGNIARGRNSDVCDLINCTGGLDEEGGGAVSVAFPTGTADITISKDTFIGNIANDVSPAAGNNSGRGGAISLHTTNTGGQITATLTAVTMTQNIAATESNGVSEEGRGGAIFARHTGITVKRANIYNNQATASGNGSGGGFYTREPLVNNSVEIINSVLAGNLASGNGEGAQIYINHVSSPANNVSKIVHSTLADDTLNPKEALFYHSTDASDTLAITNTIVASHAVGIQNVNVTGKGTARYILFFGNGDDHPSPGTVAFPDMTGWVTGVDPLFVNPAGNDYHIQSTSPAKDAGVDAGVTDDVDGDTRPQGVGFDIGADEYTDVIPQNVFLPLLLK